VASRAHLHRRGPPGPVLWLAAVAVALGIAALQTVTGPARPLDGATPVEGGVATWRLVRTAPAGAPLRVEISAPDSVLSATLRFRRYPSGDSFQGFSMLREGNALLGLVPATPAGGRLEHYIVLATRSGLVRIPEGRPAVIRFEGAVPPSVYWPYGVLLVAALALATRAGLEAYYVRPLVRSLTRWTLIAFFLGGLLLGTVVELFSLDACWAGWPVGDDLTAARRALGFVVWLVAALVARRVNDHADRLTRTVVLTASVVTLVAAVVPNRLGTSDVSYEALESAPAAASPGR